MNMPTRPHRLTVPEFIALKRAGRKISMLTAYDYGMAALLDSAGVDSILVGDSMSMVVQGHETTLPVTLDEIIYHAEMVGRAVQRTISASTKPSKTPAASSKRPAARRSSWKGAQTRRTSSPASSPPAFR